MRQIAQLTNTCMAARLETGIRSDMTNHPEARLDPGEILSTKAMPDIFECAITVIDHNFNNDSRSFGVVH